MTTRAYTLKGHTVEIIDWSTDSYLVRFTENGLVRWWPRELLQPAYGYRV